MLESLKAKITSASKYTRWLWWGILLAVVAAVFIGLLLRRRAVLDRISRLRAEVSKRERQAQDAAIAAETAKHEGAIDRHTEAAARIQGEIKDLEGQIKAAEDEHRSILGEIDAASSWNDLEALRRKGNSR